MMKNTFYKLQSKNFYSFYRKIKYIRKSNEQNIFKDYVTTYKLSNEDLILEKMNESMQESKYIDALFYYDVNKKIIIKKKDEIEVVKNEAKEKYKNQVYDSINPIFLMNSVIMRKKYLYYSKLFNLAIFFFLLYITSDINLQFFKRTYNFFKKSWANFIKEHNLEINKDKSTQTQENISEETDEEEDIPFSFFPKNDKEFKLAKNVPDRLSDVKGIDEVKEEIEEIVNMLKNPQKYEEAGAKLIRGVLLVGQPGTGKTLLARALAGESGINFIFLSASEFEQSLVGMGSIKLKKLFRYAKKNTPCIIFIDEIDSLLHKAKRSGKFTTSHERSVLNTFLNEMDGFKKREYVFVMGATNFIDNLDNAALRPGRFDKIINVPIPDTTGRKEIFDLYIKKIKMHLKEDVDTQTLSKMTPGFTGAEIANMVNHAIISAVDKNAVILTKKEFEEARDRIILGLIKKSGFKTDKQLLYSAIHEAGHTLVCYMNPLCKDSIFKVSVVPRGNNNKGKTSTLFEDREGTKEEFQTMIDMALGGVLAEEIYFGTEKVTSGCGNDLNRASALAKSMVKKYGMNSSDWGYMVVDDGAELEHRIGSNTRDTLDTASQKIVETSEKRVRNILSENLNKLKDLAQKLCEYEELNKEEIDQILSGKSMDKENGKKTAKRSFSISSIAI